MLVYYQFNTWSSALYHHLLSQSHISLAKISHNNMPGESIAGTAQWLERRTRDWKVAGSNPCWSGGRIFFSRVDFLC